MGWRLFAIGAIAAAAIVFGYLAVGPHYFLWMAVCGGGALIAGLVFETLGIWDCEGRASCAASVFPTRIARQKSDAMPLVSQSP